MVRKHDPSLNQVVDRLEEDHLKVHHITERIAVVAAEVAADASGISRYQLVEALADLERSCWSISTSKRKPSAHC